MPCRDRDKEGDDDDDDDAAAAERAADDDDEEEGERAFALSNNSRVFTRLFASEASRNEAATADKEPVGAVCPPAEAAVFCARATDRRATGDDAENKGGGGGGGGGGVGRK